MGKILTAMVGLLVAVVGVILLVAWRKEFLIGLMAAIPLILIIGGLVALFLGVSELKETLEGRKEENKE